MATKIHDTKSPNRLYKYRVFNTAALQLITNAALYYSNPHEFNDPLDCDPSIEIDSDLPTLEQLCYAMLLKTIPEERAKDQIATARYNSTEYITDSTEAEIEDYHKRLLASDIKRELDRELGAKGVLSLSATWSSPLMWSHYADHHRGICIEYDTTKLAHPNLRPVSYSSPRSIRTSDLVQWKVKGSTSAEKTVNETFFFAKSPQWKYEREWRDIMPASGLSDGNLVIGAIYFGMRCDGAVITSLIHLLHREKGIKFYDVYSRDHSFRLHRRVTEQDEILARGIRTPVALIFKDVFLSNSPYGA